MYRYANEARVDTRLRPRFGFAPGGEPGPPTTYDAFARPTAAWPIMGKHDVIDKYGSKLLIIKHSTDLATATGDMHARKIR